MSTLFFIGFCFLIIFGIGLLSYVFCSIPQVKKAIIKLLNI